MSRRLTRRELRELARKQQRVALPKPLQPSAWYWVIPRAVALLVYARGLSFLFIYDDVAEIRGTGSLWTEISQPVHVSTRYYRPVVSAFSYFVHLVAGLDPSKWHLSSVLLHGLATFMLYRVAIEFLGDAFASSCAAVLFAIHPAHIEAVSWISANNEPIYTILFLCATLCLLTALRTGRPLYTWLALIAWLAMLFSKETAIALVPVFFLLARRRVIAALPFLAAAIAYLVVRMSVLHVGVIGSAGIRTALPWQPVLYTGPIVGLSYLRKLIWPAGLSPAYETRLLTAPTSQMWLCVAVLGCVTVALVWIARKHWLVGICVSIVVLPLFPVLYGMRFFATPELVQDRYLYLPSVGVCLLAGLIVKHLWASPKKRNICAAGGLLLASSYLWLLFTQQA